MKVRIIAVTLVCWTIIRGITAAHGDGPTPAKVFSLQGGATITRGTETIQAAEAMVLQAGDEIIVGDPGRVALELPDGSYIRLASGSKMRFPKAEKTVGLLQGALHFFSHSEQHPTVVTEHVTAAIRGTEFTLTTTPSQTTISMLSGTVQGSSSSGTAALSAGQGARFGKGKAPEVFTLLTSDRSVQWSAFIPLLGSPTEEGSVKGSREERAFSLAQEGRADEALKLLPAEKKGCSPSSLLRARILLANGGIAAGTQRLESCLQTSSSPSLRSSAAASLALTRIAQGDAHGAGELAEQALNANPASASARLAQSYVLQDKGDLDGALAVIESTGSSRDETLVARRAEILFMFGRVPQARELLESLPQRSWYADTVLGFVLMGDRDIDEARVAFARAATSEPGAGLPQLGLGLVEVNKGNLDQGRAHFERATVLEPQRSLYRSYLAKSYFEADTYAPAEPEYTRAIELDPNDPTPHLYRSFMRLAQNKPVEALRDIEAARDLSDKRSVYRSKFLLDEDSAVQSASLSRVYRDLGFEQRGRIEAISALYDDYENASAHRLLSETEDNVFGAATSLSERRISDLFAPLSINVVDSIGTGVSLNEYSQLFERDGWRTGVSGGYRTADDTFQAGVLSANKTGNLVTGLTASGVFADGAIDEPRSNEGRVGLSFQGQPTWADRFLLETRGTFFDNDQEEESNNFASGSVGGSYLHKFSPDTSAIVQSSYRRGRDRLTRPELDSDIFYSTTDGVLNDVYGARFDQKMSQYESASENEVQLIDRTGVVTSVLTGKYSYYELDGYDHSTVLDDDLGFLDGAGIEFDSQAGQNLSTSGASYLATIQALDSLAVNLGGDYSHVEFASAQEEPYFNGTESNSKVTPKAGLVFKPSHALLMRVGYGQNLGKSAQSSLASIEPTLVGGITQRYNDDFPGTISENFGTGIDLNPVKDTYLGAEWTRRWLDEPRVGALYSGEYDPATGELLVGEIHDERADTSITQDFVSGYLYHIVSEQFVVGQDYRYSLVDAGSPDESRLTNHYTRSFGRYFFTNMFFAQAGAAYRYQDRLNSPIGLSDGSSSGWLFDAALGYRLPTRQGFITAGVNNILGQDFVLDQGTYFNEIVVNDPVFELAARMNF